MICHPHETAVLEGSSGKRKISPPSYRKGGHVRISVICQPHETAVLEGSSGKRKISPPSYCKGGHVYVHRFQLLGTTPASFTGLRLCSIKEG